MIIKEAPKLVQFRGIELDKPQRENKFEYFIFWLLGNFAETDFSRNLK